ncbi:hypothetical protein K439DRAFT_1656841 [Ramaria rubella]|nr:hypothetical protein K439DRAFT_1656841 [Ramaria rubella]
MCGLSLTGNIVAFRLYHEKFHGTEVSPTAELWCLVVPRGQRSRRSRRSCVSRRQHLRVTGAPLAGDINGAGACVLAMVDDEHRKHLRGNSIHRRIARGTSCSSSATTSTTQTFIFPPVRPRPHMWGPCLTGISMDAVQNVVLGGDEHDVLDQNPIFLHATKLIRTVHLVTGAPLLPGEINGAGACVLTVTHNEHHNCLRNFNPVSARL